MLQNTLTELARVIRDSLPNDLGSVATTAKELSLAFTSERAAREADYMSSPEKLAAYVAAFLLPNAVKVARCLGQIPMPAEGRPVSVLDIGAGPGTAALAASCFFAAKRPGAEVRIAAIDRSRKALELAHRLFKLVAPPEHLLESAAAEIGQRGTSGILGGHRFDVIVMANFLNEMSDERSACDLCHELVSKHLDPAGSLIIIDTALRETTRPIMALRDRLVGEGIASVAAPCLHQMSCPMLAANERDWCHFYIDWERPEYLVKLDELSGMDHRHLKMSYMIFRQVEAKAEREELSRVVSSPLDSKGKRELVLCTSGGKLQRVRRLAKEASDVNRAFDSVKRGDLVRCGSADRIRCEDPFVIESAW